MDDAPQTEPIFTNHFQEYSLSFAPGFYKFECNTTSDWLNRMVEPIRSRVTLLDIEKEHSEGWSRSLFWKVKAVSKLLETGMEACFLLSLKKVFMG